MAESLLDRYLAVRTATEALAAPLTPEDCAIQPMDDASPVKWHLAHTAWFFDRFVLRAGCPSAPPLLPGADYLWNSYYESVGPHHERPRRGLLSRPSLQTVLDYRRAVDDALAARFDGFDGAARRLVVLGCAHEEQHQELILTDAKYLFCTQPMRPAYAISPAPPHPHGAPALRWFSYPGGIRQIGAADDGFSFDNEGPRHEVLVRPFRLASRPVTSLEFLEFLGDGGYRRPELWLSDGWAVVQAEGWRAPLYWEAEGSDWFESTLVGRRPVDLEAPVVHVSFYEADAFARWSGSRLPGEAEWELAATGEPVAGNFADSRLFHPSVREAVPDRLSQIFGDVWEWTASPYAPYPGFRAAAGALGEYNGKFMCNRFVLRGGSCATPPGHVRPTYRNFFRPEDRWQFSGIRLARE